MDDPEHAAQALPAARALSGIAPDPGHAQHMTSHIFVALGMWDDVVTANESAMRMVDAMMRSRGQGPRLCGHYSEFLDYGYLQQGRIAQAKRLLTGCRDQAAADPRFRESLISMWTRYLLDTRDWSGDVARWSVEPGDAPALRLGYWFTRGFVAARQRDGGAAREALAALELALRDVRAGLAGHGAPTPDDRESLARAEGLRLELAGLVAGGAGDRAGALDTLRQAARVEDGMALAYGPPSVDEPSHELLGEELLAAGKADEARREFETALTRTPGRTSVLRGLAHAARTAGDSAAASRALGKLAAIWHAADSDLPGLTEARHATP
jgi:tetratricopeptide (TPR) repeat protein